MQKGKDASFERGMWTEKGASKRFSDCLDTSTPAELRDLFVTMNVLGCPMVHIFNDTTCHNAMMKDLNDNDPKHQEYMLLRELESLLEAKYPVGNHSLRDYGLTDPFDCQYAQESHARLESHRDDYFGWEDEIEQYGGKISDDLRQCEDEWLEYEGVHQQEHLEVEKRIWKANNSDV